MGIIEPERLLTMVEGGHITKVTLDTQVLIWGIQNKARSNQQEMISKAKRFLEWLQKKDVSIVIPAVVLGEFLSFRGFSDERAIDLFNQLKKIKQLTFYPFDGGAAVKSGNLARKHPRNVAGYGREGTRVIQKADLQILAVALQTRSDCIISTDQGMIQMASEHMQVSQIPDIASDEQQLSLNLEHCNST